MLGLESSVKWRGPTRFEQRRLRRRESTPDAYRSTRRHRVASRPLGSACPAHARLTASGAEPWRTAGAVRARHHHGGTRLAPWPARSWGCRAAVCPATSRLARGAGEIAWSTGQTWRVSTHTYGRPDADLICGQGVAEDAAGRRIFGSPAGPDRARQAYRRRVRWNRDAAPAWPCPPAWWVGWSLATGQGR
jgi:hypothetical protein